METATISSSSRTRAKAKTINKILGKDWVVKACMGHIRDLPESKMGVDPEKGFEPKYVTIKGKQKVVTELKAAAKKCDAVYLAPDPDREGEAIAWHLKALLKTEVQDEQFFRVTYNEITAPAIKEAFSNPSRIHQEKVDAQQARRVLDRIVGYKVSPLLWRRIRGGSSAGRVQSVALRLVCEREKEIRDFVPEEFWVLGANVRKQVDPLDPFALRLARIGGEKAEIGGKEKADAVLADLEGRAMVVSKIIRRELSKKAMPPFITSTLQQAGSRFFGYSPSRTMRLAQSLYEGMDFGEGPVGLITYMRTDSVSISKQAQGEARTFIEQQYGAEYLPAKPNVFRSRGSAQEAHEAIRPTDVTRTPESLAHMLKPEELKVYRLIWQRFVASQMAPARIAQRTAEVDAVPPTEDATTYLFRASASEVVFPGYMKVTGEDKKKKSASNDNGDNGDEGEDVAALPPLEEGEHLDLLEWLTDQKFTQPPGRYTEASLIRALEENGVGRPSTYAQILATLDSRKYVEKEKRSLRPTTVGEGVNEFLVGHLDALFNVRFTAEMEEKLDAIEEGKVEWTAMLGTFYNSFLEWLALAKGPDADLDLVRRMLDAAQSIKNWAPEVKRGKRTYSDEKYVTSVAKQLEDGKKAISDRQQKALATLLARYVEKEEELAAKVAELDLVATVDEAKKAVEPPREETTKKFELLKTVTFNPARTVGKRTYDDAAFSQSLQEQVEGGKRLSPNQIRYLDRLVVKYKDQIENFDAVATDLSLDLTAGGSTEDVGPLLSAMEKITEWKEPTVRGKRTWDDHEFFTSLATQFKGKGQLSERQVASLKKVAARYSAQIPGYPELAEQFKIPEPKPRKGAKEA